MNTEIVVSNRSNNDSETGLVIKNNYLSQSGFNFMTGVREFENLKIVEGVAKGTASVFLTSVMVFDKNNVLIFDGDIKFRTGYSREKARQLVLEGLVNIIRESCEMNNRYFDELATYALLDKKLKWAYFKESYEAVISWAEEIGLEIF